MLTLPIKNPWFSMIRAGEKREEYREETEYWRTRLETAFGKEIHQAAEQQAETWIRLRNGYGVDRPSIQARVRLRIGQGRPEWGAEPGVEYYVLIVQAVYDEKAGMSLFWQEEPKPRLTAQSRPLLPGSASRSGTLPHLADQRVKLDGP